MDASLERELVNSYPSLFELYNKEIDGPAPQISIFGIQCGDGWFDIIDGLCQIIVEQGVSLDIVQIKEKFGGLRFYYQNFTYDPEERAASINSDIRVAPSEEDFNNIKPSDIVHEAVKTARETSFEVCELCGSPGELRDDGGWYKTRCDDCYTEDAS